MQVYSHTTLNVPDFIWSWKNGQISWVDISSKKIQGSCCRNEFSRSSKKAKHKIIIWSSNPTSRYVPKRMKTSYSDSSIAMFMAALFIIVKRWKQPKCPSTNKWINKMWYLHITKYYSAIKRNDVLIILQHGWTWKILC